MRFFRIPLIAVALIVFGATTSSAVRVDMSSPEFGSSVAVGDFVSVDGYLNSEGVSGILLLGVGLLFDNSVCSYRQDLSSTTLLRRKPDMRLVWIRFGETRNAASRRASSPLARAAVSNQGESRWVKASNRCRARAASAGRCSSS